MFVIFWFLVAFLGFNLASSDANHATLWLFEL
jgi:hypothetical protein